MIFLLCFALRLCFRDDRGPALPRASNVAYIIGVRTDLWLCLVLSCVIYLDQAGVKLCTLACLCMLARCGSSLRSELYTP